MPGDHELELFFAWGRLSRALDAAGDEEGYREAADRRRALLANREDDEQVTELWRGMARTDRLAGGTRRARQTLLEAAGTLDDDHPALPTLLAEAGRFALIDGDYRGARSLFDQSLGLTGGSLLGRPIPTQHTYGMLLARTGETENAVQVLSGALAVAEARGRSRDVGRLEHELAALAHVSGRLVEAEKGYRRALEREAQADHQAWVLTDLATLLDGLGREAEARAARDDAIERLSRPGLAHRWQELHGELQLLQGSPEAALPTLQGCLEQETQRNPDGWRAAYCRGLVGAALDALGRAEEAEAHLVGAYEALATLRPEDGHALAALVDRIVRHHEGRGAPTEAAAWAKRRPEGVGVALYRPLL